MNLLLSVTVGEDLVLDPPRVTHAAGLDRVADLRDRQLRELEDLGSPADPRTMRMIGEELRDSIRKRERLWLVTLTADQKRAWDAVLPRLLLRRLGPTQSRRGATVTPYGIAPIALVDALASRARPADVDFLRRYLHGTDGLAVTQPVYKKLLAHGVQLRRRSRLIRLLTNPKFIAYAVVMAYSALRALPVVFVKEFHGSVWVLWGIDLGTALPYTWGVLRMVTAPKFHQRFVALIVTVVTFLLPYIYFALNGSDYPFSVIVVIALLILGTFLLEGYKMVADKLIARSLRRRGLR